MGSTGADGIFLNLPELDPHFLRAALGSGILEAGLPGMGWFLGQAHGILGPSLSGLSVNGEEGSLGMPGPCSPGRALKGSGHGADRTASDTPIPGLAKTSALTPLWETPCETSSRTVKEQPLGARQWGPGGARTGGGRGRILSFWNLLVFLLLKWVVGRRPFVSGLEGASVSQASPPTVTLHTDHPAQPLSGQCRAVPSTCNQLDPQGPRAEGRGMSGVRTPAGKAEWWALHLCLTPTR